MREAARALTNLDDADPEQMKDEVAEAKDGFAEHWGSLRGETFIADEDRARLENLTRIVAEADEALADVQMRIREQEGLESELISLKFKPTTPLRLRSALRWIGECCAIALSTRH